MTLSSYHITLHGIGWLNTHFMFDGHLYMIIGTAFCKLERYGMTFQVSVYAVKTMVPFRKRQLTNLGMGIVSSFTAIGSAMTIG